MLSWLGISDRTYASSWNPSNQCGVLFSENLQQRHNQVANSLNKITFGQNKLTELSIISLLVGGHILLEGSTGTGKTQFANSLARHFQGTFQRVQFISDLAPSGILGSHVFRQDTRSYEFFKGPIFANIVLVDEINRAPSRTQSALLEAMEERQVSLQGQTYKLNDLYLIIATQNPSHHIGTFPLPEAQIDRFLFSYQTHHAEPSIERQILRSRLSHKNPASSDFSTEPNHAPISISKQDLMLAKEEVFKIDLPEKEEHFIIQLIESTRNPLAVPSDLREMLNFDDGVSFRATEGIARSAMARAWLHGVDHVRREDILWVSPFVLRHRIKISEAGRLDNRSADGLVKELIENQLRRNP